MPRSSLKPPLPAPGAASPPPLDRRRYRRLRRFLLRTLLHLLWFDVVLNRRWLRGFRSAPLPRWCGLARSYRHVAVEMGGVLVKLGQYLSTRFDLLPLEVLEELAGLQDEVPAEPFAEVAAQIERDLGRPLEAAFASVDPVPVGSASLAQVHGAKMPDGTPVVVKVLRPGIDALVETDLAAIGTAARWLSWFGAVRRRVDPELLVEEFARTTRLELDLGREGENAERFARMFADAPGVRIPGIHWELSAGSTLTLEDVSGIKIDDLPALEAAGIDRRDVAAALYSTYMEQLFGHWFLHADPHPGNLFVHPDPEEPGAFALAFVDFGMVTAVPPHLRRGIREYLIGFGTQDATRIVEGYVLAGALLPGADLERIERAHEDLLRHLWGLPLSELPKAGMGIGRRLLRDYRDLVFEAPFQFPVELLFTSRAVGLLAGLATRLDPDFDLWDATRPWATQLARRQLAEEAGNLLPGLLERLRLAWELPPRVDDVLRRLERGRLAVHGSLAPDARQGLQRLEAAVHRLTWVVVSLGSLVAATALGGTTPWLRTALLVVAGMALLRGLLRVS